jgi:hypothetical protein
MSRTTASANRIVVDGPVPSQHLSDWAGAVTTVDPVHADAPAHRSGRRTLLGLGAAMVLSPVAMTAWFLVEPSVLPREDAVSFLASVADAPGRYLAGTVLVLLSGLLGLPAAVGFARLLRQRLPRFGAVVGVLMGLSALGLCVQVGFRAFVWSLVDAGHVPAESVASYTRFQEGGLFDVLVAPGLVFGGLATLFTVVALLRTRQVPRWAPGLMILGMVLASGEFADVVTISGAALGVVANLALVRALLGGR